jgi:signal peptidase I
MSPCAGQAPARSTSEVFLAPKEAVANPVAAKIRANGSVCFRVLGASMFPWIRSGDLVFVRKFELEQVLPGDVVLFVRGQRLFVHRVIRREMNGTSASASASASANASSACMFGGRLITKGDALDREDPPVTRAEFQGRVIRVHRGNRHIDMGSLGRVVLGRLIARFSWASALFYRPARTAKHLFFD